MAKRKKSKKSQDVDATSTGKLSHNPFAGLADIGGNAPEESNRASVASAVNAASPVAPRFPDKLVLRREIKGRGGKTVTRISGIPAEELAALASEMKKALGCGATIENGELLLLGSLVDRAASWLEKAGATKVRKGN